jgi:hypothetical protein
LTVQGFYSRALRAGLRPEEFWSSTLAEVAQMVQAHEEQDRMSWMQTSHQMALLYNINRGKAKALSWEDFNPYRHVERKTAPPAELNEATLNRFQRMTETMNARTNGHQ